MRVICQVTEVEPTSAVSSETETVEDIIKKLLPSDRDLLIQQLNESDMPTNAGGTGAIIGD